MNFGGIVLVLLGFSSAFFWAGRVFRQIFRKDYVWAGFFAVLSILSFFLVFLGINITF